MYAGCTAILHAQVTVHNTKVLICHCSLLLQPGLEPTSSNAAADTAAGQNVEQMQNYEQTVTGISYSWCQSYGLRKVPEGFIGPALGEVHVSQVGPR